MRKRQRYNGFSLTEVLLAVATLAVGMLFIGGTFLVGIHLSTISAERTTAAVAADEVFAKVRLYGVDTADPNLRVGQLTPFDLLTPVPGDVLMYPSTRVPMTEKQYCWTALCRRVNWGGPLVQVTVFISRRAYSGAQYWVRDPLTWPGLIQSPLPRPVPVAVVHNPLFLNNRELQIKDAVPSDAVDEATFINDGYTIVDGRMGQIYQVLERYADKPDTILLNAPWQGPATGWVWVVPPSAGGGRKPCIAVYQREILFEKLDLGGRP
jgi:hypothetical protein